MGIGRAATATLSSSRRTTAFAPSTATDIGAPRSSPGTDPICRMISLAAAEPIRNGPQTNSPRRTVTARPMRTTRGPFHPDPDDAPAAGSLMADQLRFLQLLPPVRAEAAMGRAADGVLVHADPRREEPGSEVERRIGRAAGDDHPAARERLRAGACRAGGSRAWPRRRARPARRTDSDRRSGSAPGSPPSGSRLPRSRSPPTRRPRAGNPARCRAARGGPTAGRSGSRSEGPDPGGTCPSSQRTCAVARVAWPQRSTSVFGVNHRRLKRAGPSSRVANAVSDRFISAATSCIHRGSRGSERTQTAAGLPEKRRSVKASTWVMRWAMAMSWSGVTRAGSGENVREPDSRRAARVRRPIACSLKGRLSRSGSDGQGAALVDRRQSPLP